MRKCFVIALAWPETLCKKAGGWYDPMMQFVGISKGNYYRVGHSAVILVEVQDGSCHYFDFGRYHAPGHHGRVRDAWSDHELIIRTKAVIINNQIENLQELLYEIQSNNSCHGDGQIYASYIQGDFDNVYRKAKQMQEKVFIPYGPFVWKGTNCSRFVHTIVKYGNVTFLQKVKMILPWVLSPSPLGILKGLGKIYTMPKIINIQVTELKSEYEYQTKYKYQTQ